MPGINSTVSRVTRSKAQAKESYDRLSPFYDFISGNFEDKVRTIALERLHILKGETVLEIGFGTGHSLKPLIEAVGENGKVYGIDISSGMLAASRRRLEKAGMWIRVELTCDDALQLPYAESQFDAVFLSFVLELFDTPEIPKLLAEIMRVLRPSGRLGVVSMSKEGGFAPFVKLYEWFHQAFPQFADCRPIYAKQSMMDAGFELQFNERFNMMGLPGEVVVGVLKEAG